jgi:hypothetical protein
MMISFATVGVLFVVSLSLVECWGPVSHAVFNCLGQNSNPASVKQCVANNKLLVVASDYPE